MIESKNVNEFFDTLAKILLRCFVLGYFFLLLWFFVYVFAGDLGIGSKLLDLTPHDVAMINYSGMAVVKGSALLFFLGPYVAIRLVLRKRG
jgi:hypothetical protein